MTKHAAAAWSRGVVSGQIWVERGHDDKAALYAIAAGEIPPNLREATSGWEPEETQDHFWRGFSSGVRAYLREQARNRDT
jgi:hypothetical protein